MNALKYHNDVGSSVHRFNGAAVTSTTTTFTVYGTDSDSGVQTNDHTFNTNPVDRC